MTQKSVTAGSQKPSSKAKKLAARLRAVQAVYQASQNHQNLRAACEEFLLHRCEMDVEGVALVPPDGALLKKILYGIADRKEELEAIIDAHTSAADKMERRIEPLLRAVLLCGCYELMCKEDDAPIVINDYLNVAHTFFERGEIGLINGVLDSMAKLWP
jgi:N utilization substance protein B